MWRRFAVARGSAQMHEFSRGPTSSLKGGLSLRASSDSKIQPIVFRGYLVALKLAELTLRRVGAAVSILPITCCKIMQQRSNHAPHPVPSDRH